MNKHSSKATSSAERYSKFRNRANRSLCERHLEIIHPEILQKLEVLKPKYVPQVAKDNSVASVRRQSYQLQASSRVLILLIFLDEAS